MNAVMPNFMTMTADGAVLLHKKMLVATEDMGEIVSAKRMLEDEDAPRAPEIPVIEEDPKTAAAFEALVARLEAGSQGERSDDGDVSSSWVPIDLTMAVRVEDVEPPSLLGRSDGRCLLYPGRTHAFQGESETLKSWAAQLATVQVVRAGKNVLYIDYEDDERGVVSRLMAMGLEPHQILEHLTYIRPDEPLRTKNDELTVGGNDFCDVLESRAFALAIIDGLTEAMTTEGLDLNSNSDVANLDAPGTATGCETRSRRGGDRSLAQSSEQPRTLRARRTAQTRWFDRSGLQVLYQALPVACDRFATWRRSCPHHSREGQAGLRARLVARR